MHDLIGVSAMVLETKYPISETYVSAKVIIKVEAKIGQKCLHDMNSLQEVQ